MNEYMSRAGASGSLFAYIWLPTMLVDCWGGFSLSRVFGKIPTLLNRQTESVTVRGPPVLVPEYPMALCSATTSEITAS